LFYLYLFWHGLGVLLCLIELKKNASLNEFSTVRLELSFNGPSQEVLEDLRDQSIRNLLTQAEFWEQDLRAWIEFIRADKSLTCHEVVRHTEMMSMGLQFTDDSTIAELNATWRQKEEKTDVLSFPIVDENIFFPKHQFLELGDVVVSIPTAESQAEEQDHSLLYELRWLVSHGLLHLLGWVHPTSKSLKEMLGCQKQLLSISGNLQSK